MSNDSVAVFEDESGEVYALNTRQLKNSIFYKTEPTPLQHIDRKYLRMFKPKKSKQNRK